MPGHYANHGYEYPFGMMGAYNRGRYGGGSSGGYYGVSGADPEAALASIARQDEAHFQREYAPFEDELIGQIDDTSLVSRARTDSAIAGRVARGIQQRNAERYGISRTPSGSMARDRRSSISNALREVHAVSDARIGQREVNQTLLSDLLNIGQGLDRASLGTLQNAASNYRSQKNAERQQKSQNRANRLNTALGVATLAATIFGI